MSSFRSVIVMTAICLGMFAPARAQQVSSDYDHNINFSQYHSYTWQKIAAPDSIWENRIQDAVDEQLAKKGWVREEQGGQTVLCAIGTTATQTTLETFYTGMGPGWGWRGWGPQFGTSTTIPQQYAEGTLIIDVFDAKSQQLLWRGFAKNSVSSKAQTNINNLDKAVVKLLKNFPPPPPKK